MDNYWKKVVFSDESKIVLAVQTSVFTIDLVTVFDAILTSRQTCEKLQCLYENLMSNNFRRMAVLKKYDLLTKASLLRILLKPFEGVTCTRRPITTFSNFLFICL